ncbi:MAG: NAD(P)H-binding protein [Candidatus Poseidoniales archaeon]|nr:NAD(P)H-binding protein [Candidatus Poseidoniales archaeon]
MHVVTGAFGYTGRWIAHQLLEQGEKVRTLTNAVGRDDPFDGQVEVHPLDFEDKAALVESLRGADVLYNTYWVRYNHQSKKFDHGIATRNCSIMFEAAKEAGVRRIVHFSVAHPDQAPGWSYFAGKVDSEESLKKVGISYAIVRPTVLFGGGRNVLVNNIAWMLRYMPVFGYFGWGNYPMQPVHVRDVARIAIELGAGNEDITRDAAGPETYRYKDFVKLIGRSMRVRRIIMPVPPLMGWMAGQVMGVFLKDMVITRAEIKGLMQGLVASDEEPLGVIKFSEWIEGKGDGIGRKYHNDLKERKYSR